MGHLIIISSPSGGGKDSVIREMLKIFPRSSRLITTTTKPPRKDNQEGVDYYFISRDDFENKIKNDEFAEYNIYAGNYYGTEKKNLNHTLAANDLVFTQVEVNGKHNLDKAGIKNLSIFLLPENMDILEARIRARGSLSEDKIQERLIVAKKEIQQCEDYDYKIVNYQGKLDETIENVADIIRRHLANIDKKA